MSHCDAHITAKPLCKPYIRSPGITFGAHGDTADNTSGPIDRLDILRTSTRSESRVAESGIPFISIASALLGISPLRRIFRS